MVADAEVDEEVDEAEVPFDCTFFGLSVCCFSCGPSIASAACLGRGATDATGVFVLRRVTQGSRSAASFFEGGSDVGTGVADAAEG